MDRLGRQIEHELGRITPAGAADMVAIVRAWPAAVGEENARRAWPARLARDGTLHVNAADSVWAFQLGMLAESILERLHDHLGEATPSSLRFTAGPIPEPAAEPPEPGEKPLVAVGSEDAAEGALLAAEIEDEELRELVARAAAASLARTRSDRRF